MSTTEMGDTPENESKDSGSGTGDGGPPDEPKVPEGGAESPSFKDYMFGPVSTPDGSYEIKLCPDGTQSYRGFKRSFDPTADQSVEKEALDNFYADLMERVAGLKPGEKIDINETLSTGTTITGTAERVEDYDPHDMTPVVKFMWETSTLGMFVALVRLTVKNWWWRLRNR